jgi:hypothetical protein
MTTPARLPREIDGNSRTVRDTRQVLYQQLADRIWNPDRLEKEATS